MLKVSVIIPHFEDLEGLDRCLSALAEQTYPRSEFEVIVADNASRCGHAAVRAVTRDRARLVIVNERGAGPARNGGVAASSADVLAFTDADCVPEPQWLSEGLAALREHDFVGGRVDVLVDNPQAPSPAEAFERVFAFDFADYILNKGFTGSGNMFVTRRVFDKVGGFRVGVSEDKEWSHRARALGFVLGYAPNAVVGHPARRSWSELKTKWLRVNSESFGLALSERHGRLKWLVRTLAMPLSALAHTPRVFRSTRLPSYPARLGAALVLYRLRLWRCIDGLALLTGFRR